MYIIQETGQATLNQFGIQEAKLFSVKNALYVIGSDFVSERMRILRLSYDNELKELPFTEFPVDRKNINIEKYGKYVYLTGGTNPRSGESVNDVWRFDTDLEIWEQIPITLNGDFQVVIPTMINGEIVWASPVIDDMYHSSFKISNPADSPANVAAGIEYIEIPVTEVEYFIGDDFCLYEDGTFLLGGRLQGGNCNPFTVPQYDTYSIGATVNTVAGSDTKLAVGTGNDVRIYDITDQLYPTLVHTQNVYGPVSDILVYENKLIVAVENGIDTIDLETYAYVHTATYGTTKALESYNDKLYVGDGQGIKVFDPETLTLLSQLNTSGDVTQLEIIDGVIHTFEWAGLKRYDAETLAEIQTDTYYVYDPETFVYNSKLYIFKNNSTVELTFNGSSVTEVSYVGDEVELRNHYTYGNYTYFPEGTGLRISTTEEDPAPICGNSHLETGEVCDGGSVACITLSGDYIGGTAYCNSLCSGYNEDNCEEDDGW